MIREIKSHNIIKLTTYLQQKKLSGSLKFFRYCKRISTLGILHVFSIKPNILDLAVLQGL